MQICPRCNLSSSDASRFCAHCGQPLAGGATGQLLPQSTLAGRYIIVRLLGKGGMGAVYLASDNRIAGKMWAVKEMSDAALLDPHEKQAAIHAFQSEANLLASLDHPNIPKVVDSFGEAGKYYLVMDFVPGKTLEKMLEEQGASFSEQQAAEWGVQLCDVLDYLHSRQPPVIFRDLKPGNVILQPDGAVKLIDFGIARLFKPGRRGDTTLFGTPGFAAPEQHGRAQTDGRSDLYSLGVLLHHLTTGHEPAADPFNLPPVRRLNPRLSTRFEGIVARATAFQTQSRFQSAPSMRQALSDVVAPPPHPPPPPPPPSPSTPRKGGRWTLAILAVVLVAALAAGISSLASRPIAPPATVVAGPPPAPAAIHTDTPPPALAAVNTSAPPTDTPKPLTSTATPIRPTPTPPRPTPTPPRSTPTPDPAAIRAEVESLLFRWSEIHKRAVRQVREDELAGILAGEALEKQLGSVRWLREHNAFWDVTTYDRRIDAWEYVTPDWVRVVSWRDEQGDYYLNGKYSSSASYRQQYRARFVLERIEGRWYITCKGSLEAGKPEPCLLAPP